MRREKCENDVNTQWMDPDCMLCTATVSGNLLLAHGQLFSANACIFQKIPLVSHSVVDHLRHTRLKQWCAKGTVFGCCISGLHALVAGMCFTSPSTRSTAPHLQQHFTRPIRTARVQVLHQKHQVSPNPDRADIESRVLARSNSWAPTQKSSSRPTVPSLKNPAAQRSSPTLPRTSTLALLRPLFTTPSRFCTSITATMRPFDGDNDNDMTMTHSEKSHINQMRAWPYRQEYRDHGPSKKNLFY